MYPIEPNLGTQNFYHRFPEGQVKIANLTLKPQ